MKVKLKRACSFTENAENTVKVKNENKQNEKEIGILEDLRKM